MNFFEHDEFWIETVIETIEENAKQLNETAA